MRPFRLSHILSGIVTPARTCRERCIRDDAKLLRQPSRLNLPYRQFSTCVSRPADIQDQFRQDEDDVETARHQENMELLAEEDFKAAPEIDFEKADREASAEDRKRAQAFLRKLRVVPESPSYFTARPSFTDDYLHLQTLLRRYIELPALKPAEAPRIAWREFGTYQGMVNEPLRSSRFKRLVKILKRLNLIHPQLMPDEVQIALNDWARDIQPFNNRPAPIEIDEFGRAAAVGRRKSSSAKVWVVEGEGDVLVNGKPLHQMFARLHDRESVVWALKATQRADKYNIFATVHGGGTTGQAEALTLAIGKALMAHEPDLKPALRRGKYRIYFTCLWTMCDIG